MPTLDLAFTSGSVESIQIQGGMQLMIRDADAPVTVKYFRLNAGGGAQEISTERAEDVEPGYKGRPPVPLDPGPGNEPRLAFDYAVIESSTTQTVKLYVTAGFVDDDRVAGNVGVNVKSDETIPNTLWDAADIALTTAGVTTVIGAGTANKRRTLIVRNLSAGDNVRLGSTAATASRGVQLRPGEVFTIETTAAIYGIAETGTPSVSRTQVYES